MPLIEDIVFLRPWWLLAIPAGLAGLLLIRPRETGKWMRVCDPKLLAHLLVGESNMARRHSRLLIASGWTLACIALAGPAWDTEDVPLYGKSHAVVIAISLSASMNSPDLPPSRLDRARFAAIDLIESNPQIAAGLVVFAGDVFDVAPVSEDAKTVIHLLHALDTGVVPVQGRAASLALKRAGTLLSNSGIGSGDVVIFTDSVDDAAFEQAAALRQAGYRLSVAAAGTEAGAPIPTAGGGFATDIDQNIILAPTNLARLEELADAGGGTFRSLTHEKLNLSVSADHLSPGKPDLRDSNRLSTTQWKDRGVWLLLAVVPLAALIFRRGWLFAACLWILFPMNDSYAFDWTGLWKRSDQQASEAYERGSFTEAAAVAPSGIWRGAALYRDGIYGAAAAEFSKNSTAAGHYNQGNALAKAGDLPGAVEQYEAALRINPDFEDAQFNRELVLKAMQSQQGMQGEPQRGDSNQDNAGDAAHPADDPQEQGRTGETMTAPQYSASGSNTEQTRTDEDSGIAEDGEKFDQASAATFTEVEIADEEMAQTMDQWLRQIPDDPGGLLRRKFLYQSHFRNRSAAGQH